MEYATEYQPPVVTVDGVVFQLINGELSALFINRAGDPFAGQVALPGGYCAAGETSREALERIIARKTGLQIGGLGVLEQLYTFDSTARDPRGAAISITYLGLGRDLEAPPGSATEQPVWHALKNVPALAFDHKHIIDYALGRLRSKLSYTNAIFALLPATFTMSELQTAYEAVLGHPVDKRNFRKKYLAFEVMHETTDQRKDGAHRPARLYRFNHQYLESLPRNFD